MSSQRVRSVLFGEKKYVLIGTIYIKEPVSQSML